MGEGVEVVVDEERGVRPKCRVQGAGSRVSRPDLRLSDFDFRVQVFQVQGAELRFQILGFRVSIFRFRFHMGEEVEVVVDEQRGVRPQGLEVNIRICR